MPPRSQISSSGEGHIEIPLGSLPANRAMGRVQSAIQETQCSSVGGDRHLRLPLKFQLGNQASSVVEAWNSAFSRVAKWGSGLLSLSGVGFGLFQ